MQEVIKQEAEVRIKPISVNACWQGRRFKSKEYKQYEKDLMVLLPNDIKIADKANLGLRIDVYVSSMNSDVDNVAKPFIDIMQKKYGFNDRYILELYLFKHKVAKGEEKVKFEIYQIKR